MTIDIVPIAEQHLAGFHAVLDEVARQRKYLALLEAPSLDTTREFVRRNMQQRAPHLVALDDEKVVGWCDIVPDIRDTCRHCGRLAMGVLPDYRGRGIGQRLLAAALAAAEERGLERIELHVLESNEIAINLYKRFGFEQDGLLRNARKLDGRYENKITMSLLLKNYDRIPQKYARQQHDAETKRSPREQIAGGIEGNRAGNHGRENGAEWADGESARHRSARSP